MPALPIESHSLCQYAAQNQCQTEQGQVPEQPIFHIPQLPIAAPCIQGQGHSQYYNIKIAQHFQKTVSHVTLSVLSLYSRE